MEIYKINHLSFAYPEKEGQALQDVTIQINQGDFTVVCGKSGCGKSTLLRHLKTVLTPHGERKGEILYMRQPINAVSNRIQAEQIGFVSQNPDNQIVTDKVWHELAFGLESLGVDSQTIRLRVAEIASFFGIQNWFAKDVTELSGGQKQLLNLASIMAMHPRVLILDEPTAQLDPIAASDFLAAINKINKELGVTVILTEHRLEEVFPMADKVIVMEDGQVLVHDTPINVGLMLKETKHKLIKILPSAMQIFACLNSSDSSPITVRDGRNFLNSFLGDRKIQELSYQVNRPQSTEETIIELRNLYFRYERNGTDILKGLSLNVPKGRLYTLLGGNGTGKSTLLSVITGINKVYRGQVFLSGKPIGKFSNKELFHQNIAMLPQNPQSIFVKKTVELDLLDILEGRKLSKDEMKQKVNTIADQLEITHLLSSHPYDLSGGEQQRAALAKVLLLEPQILLLDEPTKGLDCCFKDKLASILKRLLDNKVTILMVSHDIEFCAKYADICALCFNGSIISEGDPRTFFSGNSFYTTAANRISRLRITNAITNEDVIECCQQVTQQS
ncbi:energy-coupling factor transporter ATPase [Ectobacillus sp. JY-23]|uniref:ABC transporter ATP-binding protein n=1 Tax=Ectobacillus sp. JY-23 TaxID=2933872 RepID=UPI001FF59507|nr:ATP-binding cassette domain-containing protein [Ectobacillus sp. JY-23]UOY91712.1 energy-coupling factor transporter ATPase [Ectobacillus sp. JY-23]